MAHLPKEFLYVCVRQIGSISPHLIYFLPDHMKTTNTMVSKDEGHHFFAPKRKEIRNMFFHCFDVSLHLSAKKLTF